MLTKNSCTRILHKIHCTNSHFRKKESRRSICIDQQKAEGDNFRKFIMIGEDVESIVTKRTRRGRWGDWVYKYEVDMKQQVKRQSMGKKWKWSGKWGEGVWVRSGHEEAGEETEFMGTKWTRSGRWGDWVYKYEVDTKRQSWKCQANEERQGKANVIARAVVTVVFNRRSSVRYGFSPRYQTANPDCHLL